MKKGIYYIVALIAICATSCDDHTPLDMNLYPGFVLCDDHQAMSLEEYQNQSSRKAVGVIFAVANEKHPTLAVMLDELPSIQFSDTLNYQQGTSSDKEAYDGFVNTTALQNSYDSKTGHGSPLADAAFRFHQFGQSDYIPSVAEFQLLVRALHVVNPVISAVGGTQIMTDIRKGSCWYWTSTEVEENQGNQAWLCSSINGATIETPKDAANAARMICALNYME